MRVVVIGGSGHVGGYLVPRLIAAGHEVVNVTRGQSAPYRDDPAWNGVQQVVADREAEDDAGTFGPRIADLDADAVIDLICFTPASADQLVTALRGRVRLLVHIGTIWVHGTLTEVPATEAAPRTPWGEYGTQKAAIEQLLLAETRGCGLPVAIVHPGHICGPGWPVVNPQGNHALGPWITLAKGEPLAVANFGLETVHHVHADDVAQLVMLCLSQPDVAAGEAFHAVSERALTLRGFAEAVASWFGRAPDLKFVPFAEFSSSVDDADAQTSYEHIARSHSMSIEKARRQLGYAPGYTSLAAVAEAVTWLQDQGQLGDGLNPLRFTT